MGRESGSYLKKHEPAENVSKGKRTNIGKMTNYLNFKYIFIFT